MIIHLKTPYKSLTPFISEKLENFTIITGKNGSGKSQLLELIARKARHEASFAQYDLEITPKLSKIQFEGLAKENSFVMDHSNWRERIQQIWQGFERLNSAKKIIEYIDALQLRERYKELLNTNHIANDQIPNDNSYKKIIVERFVEIRQQQHDLYSPGIEREVLTQLFQPDNEKVFKFVIELLKKKKKSVLELSATDFYNTPMSEEFIDHSELFNSQIEVIFYNYAKRREDNDRADYDKHRNGKQNDSISDEEFVKLFRPPWEIINEILIKHNIHFYFKGIVKEDFSADVQYKIFVHRKDNHVSIDYENLSSGEKVIIGLILKLFTTTYYGESLQFPELLIMDEPDAHLHPEMSKLLIDVLYETFVKQYGIKIIFSTHSPSTIALSPENNIYQLQNGSPTTLQKISKDAALSLLTNFIPTLSINYKNRRQVFVESVNDVAYFEKLYKILSRDLIPEISLTFISSGESKTDKNGSKVSNCDQVINIVQTLREAGNNLIWGIIDFDDNNKSTHNTRVLGEGKRYSIENYLLDPILIAGLLLRDKHINREDLGLKDNETYIDFKKLSNEQLQEIANFVIKRVESNVQPKETILQKCKLLNDKEIGIPEWYLNHQGHTLEEIILKTFPKLNAIKKGKEELLKMEIINKIIDDIPEVMSKDILDVLINVQKV